METLEVASEQFDAIHDLSEFASNGIAYSLDGYRAFFAVIGPEMASKILATYDEDYRKLRPKHADAITEDMKNGKFILDGSPIRLDDNNHILDGQHRMASIIASGMRIEFLIVDHLPVATYDTVDTNSLVRTYMDVLRRRGFSDPSGVTALTRYLHKWYNPRTTSLDSNYRMSIAMLDSVLIPNQERIKWAVQNASNLCRKIDIPKSLLSLALFTLGEVSESSIKGMLIAVAEGEDIHRGMPEYTLQQRLILDHRQEKDKARDPNDTMYLIFRAWVDYHRNLSRHPNNLIKLDSIPRKRDGVTIQDLKNMMATD